MHRKIFTIPAVLILLVALAHTQTAPTASTSHTTKNDAAFTEAMQKLENTWVSEFNARHAEQVTNLYAPDAVLMRWDGTVHGHDSILAEFQRSAAAGTGQYVVHSLRAEHSGDLGFDTGAYNVTIRGRVVEGNYLMVVKKIAGEWKIVSHATVANPATP